MKDLKFLKILFIIAAVCIGTLFFSERASANPPRLVISNGALVPVGGCGVSQSFGLGVGGCGVSQSFGVGVNSFQTFAPLEPAFFGGVGVFVGGRDRRNASFEGRNRTRVNVRVRHR